MPLGDRRVLGLKLLGLELHDARAKFMYLVQGKIPLSDFKNCHNNIVQLGCRVKHCRAGNYSSGIIYRRIQNLVSVCYGNARL